LLYRQDEFDPIAQKPIKTVAKPYRKNKQKTIICLL